MELKVYYLLVVTITILCGPLVCGVALLDAPAVVKPEIINQVATFMIFTATGDLIVSWA